MADEDLVWRALADPTRRDLLDLLAQGPRTTGELVDACDALCRTAVMKHLDLLEGAGLLIVRREGRTRWNYINPVPIQRVCERWVSKHVRHASSALLRLKAHVEEDGASDQPSTGQTTKNTNTTKKKKNTTKTRSKSKPKSKTKR